MAEKTVKVRIAVGVDPFGDWCATGWKTVDRISETDMQQIAVENLHEGEALYWIEAELPIPNHREATVVEGRVIPVLDDKR